MAPTTESRALGAIWGTCVADALGGPVQFQHPGTFAPITNLEFVVPFSQPAGSYSDDGAMTLALAKSFVESEGNYNHPLAIKYFVDWLANGRFSTTDGAWDVGNSTQMALSTWRKHGLEHVEATQRMINAKLNEEWCSGNGSLMRIAPIGVALHRDRDLARQAARKNSQATHPALACSEACDAFTELICLAMNGLNKEELWEAIASRQFTHPALIERFSKYKFLEDLTSQSDSDITSSGWVVDTLECGLWGFFKYDTWEQGALAVVNRGGDSDTAGAVYGALAGVYYGFEAIPETWTSRMVNAGLIQSISKAFAGVVASSQGT